jgi:zinc transporter, ZIP family
LFAVPVLPILRLAAWASGAALSAAVGPYLLGSRRDGRGAHLGISSALAAGAMLGVGYALMSVGLVRGDLAATLGALLGVGASYATHVWLGLGAQHHRLRPGRAVVSGSVHASAEGVAMGAAMAVDARFGLFLVATLAVHNVWESEVLGSLLLAQGRPRSVAAALGILTNVPQILLAVAAFAAAVRMAAAGPLLLGFGFGALTYLAVAELLPESYRSTGRTSIAVVVSVAAGVVALLGGSIR